MRTISFTFALNLNCTLTFFNANLENPRVTPTIGSESGFWPLETASCLFFAMVSLVPLAWAVVVIKGTTLARCLRKAATSLLMLKKIVVSSLLGIPALQQVSEKSLIRQKKDIIIQDIALDVIEIYRRNGGHIEYVVGEGCKGCKSWGR